MKKLFLVIAVLLSTSAYAQLEVLSNGQTVLGKPYDTIDSTASLSIWPLDEANFIAMPIITFGAGSNTYIGGNSIAGMLKFNAKNGFSFTAGESTTTFGYRTLSKTFDFRYSVKAPEFLTSSDMRLKRNIESAGNLFWGLKDLNSYSYNLTAPAPTDSTETVGKASQATEELLDDRVRFGFIAQEVQKIYPNLVVADENGLLSIDYTGFIPLLVDAFKDLSEKVKEQEEIIAELKKDYNPNPKSAYDAGQKAVLKQNSPNPFNTATKIECTIPSETISAAIYLYDLQGQQVNHIDIRERGDVVTTISASSLRPGMYIYALVTDGVETDSKRMIITD